MKIKLIWLLSFLLYWPALFNYFSHDDFFNLNLARTNSLAGFLKFLDPVHAPAGFGSYRPLTTQVYFFVSRLFNFSPLPLHLIAFIFFFADIFLVYKLGQLLLKKEKPALVATFLYAVSATHFAQLYWPSIFQELGLIFFFLLSVWLYFKNRPWLSLLAFIGALMSKETAVMLPFVLGIFIFTEKRWHRFLTLLPFGAVLAVYLYFHFASYGLPAGNEYKWDFSLKVINTLFWYLLWSFNLPEMLVDFIGPGLHLNLDLLRYYGREIAPILLFFLITIGSLLLAVLKKPKIDWRILLLGSAWFFLTLAPVIFLPWHKFTYELGVPLIGLALLLGWLMTKISSKTIFIFCFAWLATSLFTLRLTAKTHWVTTGAKVAQRVQAYFLSSESSINQPKIVFYDTAPDASLPYSPANELKIDLSNNDFFTVYYPGKFKVSYLPELPKNPEPDTLYIRARKFLGY